MIAGTSTDVSAQNTRAYVDAGVSHARPPTGVELDPATYALAGARLFIGPAFGSLYGGLAVDGSSADWIGGRLGARFQSRRSGTIGWGLTGVASAFSVGEPTPYTAITGRAIPELRLATGRTAYVLRGYGGLGWSDVTDTSQEPAVTYEADLWMVGTGLEVSLPAGSAQAWFGTDLYQAADGFYASAYAGSLGSLGRTLWGAELRFWETPRDTEVEVRLSLSVPFSSRWSGEVSAGRSGPDPLLGSPAGADGSAVFSWLALAPAGEPADLVVIKEGEPASVTFRLKYGAADSVAVIGDFSNWQPIPLVRHEAVWSAEVTVEPGLYHFGFLVDGKWHIPENAPGKVTDEFGRMNATLVVPGR